MTDDYKDGKRAVIVCEHIAAGSPVLYGERSEPLEEADSGWQFLCNVMTREVSELAQVWSMAELLEREPSLTSLIDLPCGTKLCRKGVHDKWTSSPLKGTRRKDP